MNHGPKVIGKFYPSHKNTSNYFSLRYICNQKENNGISHSFPYLNEIHTNTNNM